MISLTVPGEPRGKQRPRWGKHGTYTPKETVSYETYIKELFVIKYPDFEPIADPIWLEIQVEVSIPKSTSKKKREQIHNLQIRPTKRPDLDNVIKVFCDALQSIAYKNDSQIVYITARKFYSERPGVELKIMEALICP